jgi:protoporphyrinogen oxidase
MDGCGCLSEKERRFVKIGILGAGISGIALASSLKKSGIGEMVVFEKETSPGGLATSSIIDGYVFDLHGGHVFNTPFADVKEWVFAQMPEEEWVFQPRKAKSLFKKRIIDYPFEFALYQLPPKDGIECFNGFKEAGRGEEPENYYDWLIWKFGRPMAEKYMIPYNEKIMSYDLSLMSTRWVKGKMPLPSFKEVEKAFHAKNASEINMPHSSFYYPKQGGIQTMTDRLAAPVKDSLKLGMKIDCVERDGNGWVINGEQRMDVLVSTISLKSLIRMMPHAPSDVKRAALSLKTNTVTTTLCECAPQDISWLYIPDKGVALHRMVFQGGLSPANCPLGGMGSSVMLESTGKVDPALQVKHVNTKLGVESLRVGRIIAGTYAESYIVYDKDYADNLAVIKSYLASVGIHCLGRFAEWQYYNMDVCIKKAFELTASLKESLAS